MLSLSLYSSTQSISVATYKRKRLYKFAKKKILKKNNTKETLFVLLKKIISDQEINNLSNIFFSTGPGGFTGLRSIKALVQGLSIINKSQLISVNTFDIFLNQIKKKKVSAIIFFKSSKENFFFKFYQLSKNNIVQNSETFFGNFQKLESFYLRTKQLEKDLILISTSKNYFSGIEKKKIIKLDLDAKTLAKACFAGFGSKDLEILYHHAYYQRP